MALQTCMTDSQFWWLGQLKFDRTFFLQYMLALSLRISVSTPSPAVNHNANCLVFLWATCLLLWHLIHQRWTAPPRTSGKVRQPMLVTWSFKIWSNLFSTVHACIIFENLSFYPISCCQHFLNKPPSFFHKVPSNLITMCLPGSLRVLWEFMGKLSHIESLLWVHYKEPTGHILIKLMGTLWKNLKGSFTKYPLGTLWILCERTKGVCSKSTHWVLCWVLCKSAHHLPAGYEPGKLMGTFWKRPRLTCQVFCWVNWWVLFKCAHHLPPGFGLGELVGTL